VRLVEERMALAMAVVLVGVDFEEVEEERGGTTTPFPLPIIRVVVDEVAMEDANMSWISSRGGGGTRLCRFVTPENGNRRRPSLFFPKGLFRTDSFNDLIAEDCMLSNPLS